MKRWLKTDIINRAKETTPLVFVMDKALFGSVRYRHNCCDDYVKVTGKNPVNLKLRRKLK